MIRNRFDTTFKQIAGCQACELHACQPPLLEKSIARAQVMWVGLSAKKFGNPENCLPLSADTPTGAIIHQIESELPKVRFYKTNLVKCPPLDKDGKLRYPNEREMELCFNNLEKEMQVVQPVVVVLLGLQVAKFLFSKMEQGRPVLSHDFRYEVLATEKAAFVPVHHPSFINVYRKKQQPAYRSSIGRMLTSLLPGDTYVPCVSA